MNKSGAVRIFLAIVVGAILGYSFAVGPELYQQMTERRALLEEIATNPVYQVIAEIESANPDLTVLNILDTQIQGRPAAIMWVMHAVVDIPEEDAEAYTIEVLQLMFQNLLDYMPNKHAYVVIFAGSRLTPTVDGDKTQIVGSFAYSFETRHALKVFLEEPTMENLLYLAEQRLHRFEYLGYYSIVLAEILPREPGYIWPWDGSDCSVCN